MVIIVFFCDALIGYDDLTVHLIASIVNPGPSLHFSLLQRIHSVP